jgi:hypothetical protein
LFNLPGDIDKLPAMWRIEPKLFSIGFHSFHSSRPAIWGILAGFQELRNNILQKPA